MQLPLESHATKQGIIHTIRHSVKGMEPQRWAQSYGFRLDQIYQSFSEKHNSYVYSVDKKINA